MAVEVAASPNSNSFPSLPCALASLSWALAV